MTLDNLFQQGMFTLHSGGKTWFKINCDALTLADWQTVALLIRNKNPYFSAVEGVPHGGLILASELERFAMADSDFPLLLVDDVFSTENSMEEQRADRRAIGVVLFARSPTPRWITPIFSMI